MLSKLTSRLSLLRSSPHTKDNSAATSTMAPSKTPRTSTAADAAADASTSTPVSTTKRGRPVNLTTVTEDTNFTPGDSKHGGPPPSASERKAKPKPASTGRGRGRPPLPPGERKTKPYVPTGRPRGYGIQKALEKRQENRKKKEKTLAARMAGLKEYREEQKAAKDD
jgi:hypothetical protein